MHVAPVAGAVCSLRTAFPPISQSGAVFLSPSLPSHLPLIPHLCPTPSLAPSLDLLISCPPLDVLVLLRVLRLTPVLDIPSQPEGHVTALPFTSYIMPTLVRWFPHVASHSLGTLPVNSPSGFRLQLTNLFENLDQSSSSARKSTTLSAWPSAVPGSSCLRAADSMPTRDGFRIAYPVSCRTVYTRSRSRRTGVEIANPTILVTPL